MILTAFTALTYPIVIQFKRGGLWYALAPAGLLVWFIDVLASYTEWTVVFGLPEWGDHTITARIRSMHDDPTPSRQNLAKLVQLYLDACEPDGKH